MSNVYAVVERGVVTNLTLWDGSAEVQWPEGACAVLSDGNAQIGWTFDGLKFSNPNPSQGQTLEAAKAARIGAISAACQAAITAGFQSSALGSWCTYPSNMTDQQNLNASVVASLIPGIPATWVTPFKCQDAAGNWALVYHTAEQIRKVGQDGKSAILTLLNRNSQLQAQVMAAATVEDVYKVTW